ncbi:MAG: hypothetical protein WBF93_06385 [Pirellulales bacterium]
MEPDPLREIRDIRRQISVECDNDPEKVFDYYVAHQEKMKATGKYKFVSKPVAGLPAGTATEQSDERER